MLLGAFVEAPLATARIAAIKQQIVNTAARSLTQALQSAIANTKAHQRKPRP